MLPKLVALYEGERVLGEVQVHLHDGVVLGGDLKDIRISHYSPPSERCPPLAVLHTINPAGICFKLESTAANQDSPVSLLHASCLRGNKTAVASIGGVEVHLVAMHSRKFDGQNPCFWGYNVSSSLYISCLSMLNLRCLGIVFDLDETLIVANTMRSFEDKIEALQRKISTQNDPQRVSGMLAEVKRYQDDKSILKQYAESDQVIDNGKVIKSQSELVPALSETQQPIVRPLIRLQDKNIILTRINPLIRDTSVLVRLRPAWEELRSYLTARGRKRFEVFVCTMAEKDYALEMWRLLDPESNLINLKELSNRIVCVKSGTRKSLFNVFQNGNCHPKMALVIDDRLKVWDEKDQRRVHVVPAFAPYYAPQAEVNNTAPVLCVARNVACNVRGGFFKEFDDGMLQRISEVAYEDNIKDVPFSPDVSHYLVSEDDPSALNENRDSLGFDGMADAEVEQRLKEAISASSSSSPPITNLDPRIASALHSAMPSSFSVPSAKILGPALSFPSQQLPQATSLHKPPVAQLGQIEPNLHSSPPTEEGEVPESELDPDTRRRMLILQHGQDVKEPPSEPNFSARPPTMPMSVPRVQQRGWFPVEEEMNPRQLNIMAPPNEFHLNVEPLPIDKNHAHHSPFLPKVKPSTPPGRVVLESQRLPKEAFPKEDQLRLNQLVPDFHSFSGVDGPVAQPPSSNKDLELEVGQIDPNTKTSTGALQEIAFKCGTKVEYKPSLLSSTELHFLVEVLFAGERVGEGIGRTRREAQCLAAEGSLLYLAVICSPTKEGKDALRFSSLTKCRSVHPEDLLDEFSAWIYSFSPQKFQCLDKYLSHLRPNSGCEPGDGNRFARERDTDLISDINSFGYHSLTKEGGAFPTVGPPPSRILDPRIEASKRHVGPIAALKELCMMEGLGIAFQTKPQFSANPALKNEVYAEVEVNGQVLGTGIGLTWDEAKSEAAEKALVALKSRFGQFPYKRQGSPRSMQGLQSKRLKSDFPRVPQRMPSTGR